MKRRILFLLFGIALGAAAFWLPTLIAGSGNFILPIFYFSGPWPLLAIPYLAVFAVVFTVVATAYRLLKKPFAVSLADCGWILSGLYFAFTFFFFIAIRFAGKGSLML
jgi:hypothetical protein